MIENPSESDSRSLIEDARRVSRRYAEKLVQDPDAKCVLLRGGLVRNEFLKGSDIDIVVLTEREDPKQPGVIVEESFEIDCRFYAISRVRKLIGNQDLLMLEHIGNSEFLAGDMSVYDNLKRMIQTMSFEKLAYTWFHEGMHALNEAIDQCDIGDFQASLLHLREAIRDYAICILARNRTVCIKDKYLVKKMRQVEPQYHDLARCYSDIQRLAIDGEEMSKMISDVLSITGSLRMSFVDDQEG
ncbi:MAG: nucleotidyltransferase domain-containing protein [Candidatus Thermoplasmatota archaeon]|nr:nucleotidyltransferase domain-containing protein [Candidatus Thermoplasmatota archaeon]